MNSERREQINDLMVQGRSAEALAIVREELELQPKIEPLRDLAFQIMGEQSRFFKLILAPRLARRRWTWVIVPLILVKPIYGILYPHPSGTPLDAFEKAYYGVAAVFFGSVFLAYPVANLFLIFKARAGWVVEPLERAFSLYGVPTAAMIALSLFVHSRADAQAKGVVGVCMMLAVVATLSLFFIGQSDERMKKTWAIKTVGVGMVGSSLCCRVLPFFR